MPANPRASAWLCGALAVAAAAGSARSAEPPSLRVQVGLDGLVSTAPLTGSVGGTGTGTLEDAEVGVTGRVDLRRAAGRWDFKLDFQGREGLVGNSSMNHVYELRAGVHLLDDHLTISLGRMRVPGGFWLVVDGLQLEAKYTAYLGQSVWGGLRGYSTGRRETWADPTAPVLLPAAGTALWLDVPLVTAQLAFSYARDAIDLPVGTPAGASQTSIDRHLEDEFFVDGYVHVYPHPKVTVGAGFSLGTRYDVQFDAVTPGTPITLGVATLGAFGVFGAIEVRPVPSLRLRYDVNGERLRLLESDNVTRAPGGVLDVTGNGSFQDHALLLVDRVWRAVRIEARYRLRYRDNTDLEHRAVVGVRADSLWRGLGASASLGLDVNSLTGVQHPRAIYAAGLTFVRSYLDLGAGLRFTDGIGSGLTFSSPGAVGASGPRELFPFVLESSRVVYLRAFGTFWKMYAGIDVEENLDTVQLRGLAQVGFSL